MKKISALLLTLFLVISLAACSSTKKNEESPVSSAPSQAPSEQTTPAVSSDVSGEITLVWNKAELSDEMFDTLMKEFNRQNPNIKVKRIDVPFTSWAEYFNKVRTMIASGTKVDVIRVTIEGIQMFQKADLLLPLNDWMKKDAAAVENFEDINPKLEAPFVIDGNTYGYATDWNNIVAHINTGMLKQANLAVPESGWTKEDFLKYAQAMTTDKDGKKTYGAAVPNGYFLISPWLYNNNASIMNADMTKSTLDDPNAIEVAQFMHDLIYKYKVAPIPNPKDDQINALMTGQVGMISAGRWPFAAYAGNNFKDVEVQMLPKFKTQTTVFGSGAFSVLKSTKSDQAAYRLSAFLGSSFAQKTVVSIAGIPSRNSVMAEVLPQTPIKNWKVYSDSAELSKPLEAPPQYGEIAPIFERYWAAIMADQMDPAEGMKKAKEEIDAALAK